ncbi:MAG TPA: MFS transporter [Amycolatopsis sp.]|jgi:MHS family proline/betaine transporter-like MFS transporter|nr:MFS transporter [Amycolatopsis sp.]
MESNSSAPADVPPRLRGRAIVAACIGNFVEYYDFVMYGYFATVIAKIFFPNDNDAAALLLVFAAFAVSYAARPIGFLIFSHLGDKYGRKRPLAVAILLIAASTTLIGLLPSYAAVGIIAPILLVLARLVQGISVGGEYGGATTYIAEYSPPDRRGFYTGWQTFTIGLALASGGGLATLLTSSLPAESLSSWGWRVPFLLGAPLGLVGLYLRMKLSETPEFLRLQETAETVKSPLVASFRLHWREMLIGLGLQVGPAAILYVSFIYSPTYLSKVLGHGAALSQGANLIGLLFYCLLLPLFARLCDQVGRKPLLIVGAAAVAVVAYPSFLLFKSASFGLVVLGLCLIGLAYAPFAAALLAALSELFPTSVRYTGLSVVLNVPTIVLGGTAPLIATYLVSATGDKLSPAYFVIGGALVSLVAAAFFRESLVRTRAERPEPRQAGKLQGSLD